MIVLGAALGLVAVGGLSAAVIACGSSDSVAKGVYYSETTTVQYAKTKTDKTLLIWIPWKKQEGGKGSYSDGAASFFSRVFGVDLVNSDEGAITTGPLAGYSVQVRYTDSTAPALDYEKIGNISNALSGGDTKVIPDVIVNYGELAAILAQNGLMHDLGEAGRQAVAAGFAADVSSVQLPDGSRPSYLLPFAKSTEAAGVDVVIFAKMLADTAAAISELFPATKVLTIPADSDVDRMIRMVLAPSSVSASGGKTVVDLAMSDIFSPNPSKDADGNVTYRWQDLADAWARKTAPGGIWAPDKPSVEGNFQFRGTDEAKKALASVDYSSSLFGSYSDMGRYLNLLNVAYKLRKGSDFANSSFLIGMDSGGNNALSYQYDSSGHVPTKMSVNAGSVTVNGQEKSGVVRYDVYDDSVPAKNFQAGADWVSNLVNSGAAYLKSSKLAPYGNNILLKHGMLFSIGSSNGLPFYTDSRNEINHNEKANVGEVYFTLQPTKVDASETKSSITNQGPSLFVTKIHGTEVSEKVAAAVLGAYARGAEISDGVDLGYWGKAGYIYGNAASYANNANYLQSLNESLKDPSKWANTIGKKLHAEHVEKAITRPGEYDLMTAPLDGNTRNFRNYLETIYGTAFVNFFHGAKRLPDGVEIARMLIANCAKDGWLKLAR